MKVEKSFPFPENEPVVPDKLAEFVTNYLRGTTKIHILVYAKGGWSKANGITIEENDEASEVYSMVKMCADHHCDEHGGEPHKYRAILWRDVGDDKLQRRTLSFDVISDHLHDGNLTGVEAEQLEVMRDQTQVWQSICEEMRKTTAMMIEFGNRSVDRVLDQARQDSERIQPMTELMREMLAHYRDGLRMQATAVKEVGDMRIQQQLADAGGKDDKFWEMMAPAVQTAMMQVQQRFMGGKAPAKALPRPKPAAAAAPAMSVKRRGHQPPTSPPANSPGSVAPEGKAAEPIESTEPETPATLYELSQAVLHGFGPQTMLRLSRALNDEQAGFIDQLSGSEDDDTAARAIIGLSQSLMANPEDLAKMQSLLTAPQVTLFRQLAELASRHVAEGGSQVPPVEGERAQAGDHDGTAE